MRTFGELFALPEFRILFASRCASISAVSVAGLALGTTTYRATGSTVLTALAMFGGPLITLLGSMTVLGLSDALGPRRAATLSPIAWTVACALQALPGLPWPARFALLALPYLAGSATGGSTMRLLALVVPRSGFVLGRATLNIAVGVTQVLGYAAGGLLSTRFSPTVLFALAAGLSGAAALLLRLGLAERAGTRSTGRLGQRTRRVNARLLRSRVTGPLYLALWVPTGLVVGCEALFVPYAGASGAGYLFAVTAAGMLAGDLVIGRLVPPRIRDRLTVPLRLLLAAPYLGWALHPGTGVLLGLACTASFGYAAALPLQDRLLATTEEAVRGQAFGLSSNGMMIGQAVGALLGGALATLVPVGAAVVIMAGASILSTAVLVLPLRSSLSAGYEALQR